MKKLIALLLAMMMVFAFTACGSSDVPEEETTEAQTTTEEVTEPETETTEATETSEASSSSTEKSENVSVKAVSETVWAISDVNVRTGASTDSDRVATIKKGDKITRTGILSNGWSRVKYKDKDMYISSKYLTTKNPAKKTTQKPTQKTTKSPTKTKSTETKETTTEATETTSETTETTTEETTETTTEATTATTTEEPTDPATDTDRGTVTDCDKDFLKLDNNNKYDISKAKVDIDIDQAVGMEVVVEYYVDGNKATHVYAADGSKGVGASASGSGMLKIFVILGLIAAAIAAIVVVARNRRRTES